MTKRSTSWMPLAQTEGLSITVAGSETLVYDPESFMIHRLGPDVATVWQQADGTRDIATIATEQGLSVRAVESALTELAAMNLVDGETVDQSKISRRLFVGGAAGVAAASTLIPVSAASEPIDCSMNFSLAGIVLVTLQGTASPPDFDQCCGNAIGRFTGYNYGYYCRSWSSSPLRRALSTGGGDLDAALEAEHKAYLEQQNGPVLGNQQEIGNDLDFEDASDQGGDGNGSTDEFIPDPEPLTEEPESDPDFIPTSSEVEVVIPPEN